MRSSAACLLGLLLVAVFIQLNEAASLNSTSEGQLPATKTRLYHFDASTAQNNDHLKTMIFSKLREYSVRCCKDFRTRMPTPIPKTEKECETRQMAYWAWIPKKITGWAEALAYLELEFNPADELDKRVKEKMCNIDVTSTTEYYPFFAMPTRTIDAAPPGKESQTFNEDTLDDEGFAKKNKGFARHSEDLLFDPMKRKTTDETVNPEGEDMDFYLYTYNTPCYVTIPKKPPGKRSCTDHIFTYVVDYIFRGNANTWTGHTLNAGFYKWYIPKDPHDQTLTLTKSDSREFFCKGWNLGLDNEKAKGIDGNKWGKSSDGVSYSQYNFGQALTFTKFAEEDSWNSGETTDANYNPGHTTEGDHC